ncbi:MAG: high light inducible protein [Microcoleus sp. SIO2G3]|nr:high light inducible protein [Microcoleus sp. SIO2G3]
MTSTPPSSPAEPSIAPSAEAIAPEPVPLEPAFGWTPYAEVINGRFAMIGFVALVAIELFTHQSFFSWLGLR